MSNREIKFRAFNTDLKKMVYPTDRGWFDKVIRSKKSGVLQTITINLLMTNDYPEVELMQYTGRKDKTGADIYEGDIVEENGKLAICTWFIEAGAYAFVPTELYPCELQKLIAYHAYDTFFENDIPENYVKTIGNIYENPELLEVNK